MLNGSLYSFNTYSPKTWLLSWCKGTNIFEIREYDKSIESYKKAAGLKPTEAYPKNKIEEATRLKSELKQLEATYNKFITDADAAFNAKDYTVAKTNYEQASSLKNEEQYPKEKLLKIEDILIVLRHRVK